MKEAYFPFGFRYPVGTAHSDSNPDPIIEAIRKRMVYLNKVHALTNLPGNIFAAALDLLQKEATVPVDQFWDKIQTCLSMKEVADIAVEISRQVSNEPPRLDFPNAIAIVDCRFVATKEWEHIRRYSIGGSEASTVLELSHFQSRRSLYHEKKNPKKEERTIGSQQILDYGHRMEDYIVNEVASRLGAVRYPEWRMFAHKDYPYITCNPDAIFLFPDGHFALFESKTAVWFKRTDWLQGIPDYYAPQPLQYLEVLNDPKLTEGYIGVCFGGLAKDILAHKYVRDPVKGAAQIQSVADFWNTYIAAGVTPDFSGIYKLDIKAAYGYVPPKPVAKKEDTLPANAVSSFERYFDLQAEKSEIRKKINAIAEKESELMNQIQATVPEGLTICSIPNSITYQIKAKRSNSTSVNLRDIDLRDPTAALRLLWLADAFKDTAIQWTTPKITRAKC